MTDQLISFETAKLAKEKGFNIPVNGVYVDNGTLSFARDNDETDYNWNERKGYSAPTQSLLQKWLREVHGLHIMIDFNNSKKPIWYWSIIEIKDDYPTTVENNYNSFEEALESGLQEALKLI